LNIFIYCIFIELFFQIFYIEINKYKKNIYQKINYKNLPSLIIYALGGAELADFEPVPDEETDA
jgi:hypothetical protein